MQTITSVQNSKIQQIRKLHQTAERRTQGLFIAEGLRAVATLLESPLVCDQVYVTDQILNSWDTVPVSIKNLPEDRITLVAEHVSAKISTMTTPSGILGVFQLPDQKLSTLIDNDHTSLPISGAGIVFANLTDPGNMGTLIRTAVALNLKNIITVAGTDIFGPKVVQASAGTIGQIQILQYSDWPEFIKHHQTLNLSALVPQHGQNILDPAVKIQAKNSFLVIGNEAHGILQEQLSACNQLLTLPMPGQTESLNAAVAGAIAMYLLHVN